MTTAEPASIPLVDYLCLDDPPYLVVRECTACGARFFDRRNACAACFATEFKAAPVPRQGVVQTFTVVGVAAPGIKVPFVAAVVQCGDISVRSNLVNIPPDPSHIRLGMRVRLTTFELGRDGAGTSVIAFAFEPLEASSE